MGSRTRPSLRPPLLRPPPTLPTGLSALAGNASVSLSWSAPAFDGGSPLTGYKVYRGTSTGAESFLANTGSTATSYTDSSAANSTTYFYKVSALNLPGEGGLSNEAFATPTAPPTTPDAPTGLSALAGNASVSLSWSAPAFDGGSPLTGYKVYRGTSTGTESFLANTGSTATSYTDSSAANSTTYFYKVSALNLPGEGGLSNEAFATPTAPPTTPDAPTGLSALAGNASVSLSWSAPAFDGGSPLTGYKVYRGTSTGTESFLANTGSTATSYTDSRRRQQHHLLLQGVRAEPPRRGWALERGLGDPDRSRPAHSLPSPLDSFTRPNENPLSLGGRWGNGILGSGRDGPQGRLQPACERPNHNGDRMVEEHAVRRRLRVVGDDHDAPGNGNAVRLYVRLKTPGSAGVDGYMLLYNQLSGTDQVVHLSDYERCALSALDREPARSQPEIACSCARKARRSNRGCSGLDLDTPRPGHGLDLHRRGLRRRRHPRKDRPPRRLRRALTDRDRDCSWKGREHVANRLVATADRDDAEIAVDDQAVEAGRISGDDRVGGVDGTGHDVAVDEGGELVADGNSTREPVVVGGKAMRSAPASQPGRSSSSDDGGPSDRAPQWASKCITGRSSSPYSVSSYTEDAAGGGSRRFRMTPPRSRSLRRAARMFVPQRSIREWMSE